MAVVLAVDDYLIGALEMLRITVGCGESHQNAIACLHRAAFIFHVFIHKASHRHWGICTKEFFNSTWNEFWFLYQANAIFWMCRKMPQRRTDTAPCCINTGNQQQAAHTEDETIGVWLAVMLCMNKLTDEVACASRFTTITNLANEEILKFSACLDTKFWIRETSFQSVAYPCRELIFHRGGNTQHGCNHLSRNLLCVFNSNVGIGTTGN